MALDAQSQFEEVVRGLATDLYRYAFWLTRDRQQAEDILQEALLRAWRAFPRLRDGSAAKSWLFAIVRNEFYRMATQRPDRDEHVDIAEIDVPDERSAASGLEMREALMALPMSYAEPLALQVIGGFSCAEIAALLETTDGAIMTRLSRARQALKRLVTSGSGNTRARGQR